VTKAAELRELDDDELANRLAEARQELFNLRFQHATGQLDNSARLREMRRDIARMNTLLRDREIAAIEERAAAAEASRQAAIEARRARAAAAARGVVAGVGHEASEAGRRREAENG
jgi:large subunit ribosomal protein L29